MLTCRELCNLRSSCYVFSGTDYFSDSYCPLSCNLYLLDGTELYLSYCGALGYIKYDPICHRYANSRIYLQNTE